MDRRKNRPKKIPPALLSSVVRFATQIGEGARWDLDKTTVMGEDETRYEKKPGAPFYL